MGLPRIMSNCAIILIVAVALLSQEAEAGGKDAKHVEAKHVEAQPQKGATAHLNSAQQTTKQPAVSAEVKAFDKRLEVTEKKLKDARKSKSSISKVAKRLSEDVNKVLKAVGNGPLLGETDEVLGAPEKKQAMVGEANLDVSLPPSLMQLKSAVEADAKHNIWKQEVAADKAAREAEADAKSVVVDLSSEELGETSILHDGRVWANQEKKQLKRAKKFLEAARREESLQHKAEKVTRQIAAKYTKVQQSLAQHAKELATANAGMKWAQDDAKELSDISAESDQLAKIES